RTPPAPSTRPGPGARPARRTRPPRPCRRGCGTACEPRRKWPRGDDRMEALLRASGSGSGRSPIGTNRSPAHAAAMAPDEPTTDWYPPPPPPPPAAPPARRLERSRRDRKIAGVCGGLGDYFDIDPVIFRIGFVVLTIAGGSGILLYIAGMIFVPEEGRRRSIGESLPRHGRPLFPVILLGIGFLMLWGQMFDRHGGGFGFGFTLLAIGGFLLWRRSQRHDDWHRDDDLPPAPGDLYPPMWNPPAPDDMYPPRWNPPAPSETTSTSAPATSHPSTPSEFDGLDPFDGKPRDPDPTAAYTTAHEQAFAALPPEPEIWPPLDYQPPALPQRPSMTPVVVSFLFVVGGIAALLST